VSLVSCSMGHGGRTGERLEMEAEKAGNNTPVVAEIELLVARIEFLCSVYFVLSCLILPHCHLGVVVSQSGYLMEPCWLSLVEIYLSTSYVNKRW
jgi:hypothetical protein